ncbi:hypothetical protein ACOMHN_045346 [Nucella lapillus]
MLTRGSIRIAVKSKPWNPSEKEWTLAAQCVQPEEKERIGRFVFKKDSKSAMVGRLLIRRVVSSLLGIPYADVKLARTDKGKPYVANPQDGETGDESCNFNISHQGDFVVIAADERCEVGVDVMKVEWPRKTSVQEFLKMMDRHLTEQEWTNVRSREKDMEQLKVFYRYWCLKESVLKAMGTGIAYDLSTLDFNTGGTDVSPEKVTCSTTLKMDGQPSSDWRFEETMLEDEHCIAVALRSESSGDDSSDEDESMNEGSSEPFTVWSIEEMLSGCEPLAEMKPDLAYWNNFNAKEEGPILR